jgi:hypothetical protein
LHEIVSGLSLLAREFRGNLGSGDISQLLSALGALEAVPIELHNEVLKMASHKVRDIRSAALCALAGMGRPIAAQAKHELADAFNYSSVLARAIVIASRFELESRELVSAGLQINSDGVVPILKALNESLPEVQRLFTTDLTLLVLGAADEEAKPIVELARNILRSSGVDAPANDPGSPDDFFTFSTSGTLRGSLGLITTAA